MRYCVLLVVMLVPAAAACTGGEAADTIKTGAAAPTTTADQTVPATDPPATTAPTEFGSIPPAPTDCPTYPPAAALITGTGFHPVPETDEPEPRRWFIDPTFGTCMARVTDRSADPAPGDPSPGLVNEYARVRSFNADGTRLIIRGTEGTWYLYDAATLLPITELPIVAEPRWDPTDPRIVFHTDETRLLAYNVEDGTETLVRDFAEDLPDLILEAVWTRHEGRPSDNARFWALLAEAEGWEPAAFVVYDRTADTATVRRITGMPGIEEGIDHVTISSHGTYLLASFDLACRHGELGTDAQPCGLMAYGRDLTAGRGILRIAGHYDTAIDAEDREVIVFQDIDTDHISMADLGSGTITALWPIDFSHTALGLHFSGTGTDRPGWAVVSTHDDDPTAHTWMDDQVFLIELKTGGRVVRLAHTHSVVNDGDEVDYWAEPHAAADRTLTRILFGTNWGRTGTGEIDTYLIVLPDDWPARLDDPAG